jgi:hypothetical protein
MFCLLCSGRLGCSFQAINRFPKSGVVSGRNNASSRNCSASLPQQPKNGFETSNLSFHPENTHDKGMTAHISNISFLKIPCSGDCLPSSTIIASLGKMPALIWITKSFQILLESA